MVGLDLTGARATLDELLFAGSQVLVTDENGVADDVLDEGTGDLTPAGDSTVYDGEGLVLPLATFGAGRVPDLGIAVQPLDSQTTHRGLLPLTAPRGIRVGAQMKVLQVNPLAGDVQLVGRTFEVTEVPTNASLSVLRICFLKPVRAPVTTADPEDD